MVPLLSWAIGLGYGYLQCFCRYLSVVFVSHCVLRGLWGFLFYLGAAVVASEDDDFIGRHAEDR